MPPPTKVFDSSESKSVKLCSYRPSYDRRFSVPKQQTAVEVRRVQLSYGRSRKAKTILSGIDLNVPEASIYGLLGPSGCGKTTLLRCIVGRIKPDQGYVRIFGFQPNEPGSQIPGPAIGYMPQEIAVYDDFTIEETLLYFGRLFRLDPQTLAQRIEFLLAFLDLPNKNRMVENLSGGQKRRVSLAAALVHSPPLLILDEPTVGVDPLLRQSIWQHLVTLTQTEKITVIITTHYIEEARQANVVGLMRHGKLLAENAPEELMSQYSMDSLEDVFLKLCVTESSLKAAALAGNTQLTSSTDVVETTSDASRNGTHQSHQQFNQNISNGSMKNGIKFPSVFSIYSGSSESSYTLPQVPQEAFHSSTAHLYDKDGLFINPVSLATMSRGAKYDSKKLGIGEYLSTTMAVTWKNFVRIRRNIPVLAFQFVLPAIQVILFCLCIGADPFNIPVAIVNQEDPPFLSRIFLEKINPYLVHQYNYTSFDEAISAVKRGQMWGVLHIDEKFSLNLQRRMILGEDVDNATIEGSTIRVYPDLTNQQISYTMERTFREAFQAFAKETLNILGRNPALAELPIALGTPVYGEAEHQGYLEYMAPGVVVSICYIMATGLTALAFIIERRDGLFERSLVAGVDTMQILIAHALVQIFVMVIQIVLVLFFTFLVFDIPSRGPFAWVITLLLLQGATGMAFGLVVSALCQQENTAVMMILGTFYPNLILSGIIWPLEAMPYWIRWFSYVQPQTLPTETLRHVLSRGWGFEEVGVWSGFSVTIAWLLFYTFAAAVIFKIKK